MSYEAATTREVLETSGPRRGVEVFRDVVMLLWHDRGATDLGIFNRRRVRGGRSWSLHAVGRALDVGVGIGAPGQHLGDELALRFIAAARLVGISEVIWRRHRWTQEHGVQPYHGSDHHTTHLHLGFTKAFADTKEPRGALVDWIAHALVPPQ